MSGKIFQAIQPEIIDYDTKYLDTIEGSVVDYPLSPINAPTGYPHHTHNVPNNLVLPARQDANPLAGALQYVMTQQPTNSQQDAYAIQHMQAMSEKSTPVDRNRAKLILIAGWVAIAGIIAVGLHKAGMINYHMAWLCFVVAFAYGVYKANADENAHSPGGVERHKTDIYGKIRLKEIDAQDKAHARNHETFRQVMTQVYGGGDVQNRNLPKR